MKKLKTILIACTALILFVGCNTYQKQLKTFQAFAIQHTNELAPLCAKLFPAKDSVGQSIVTGTKPANNTDYTPELQSLKNEADSLKVLLKSASEDKSNPCSDVVAAYQAKVNSLNQKITALADAYKKCKPDTVFKTTPIYRVDQAALTACQNNNDVQRDSLVMYRTKLKASQDTAGNRLTTIWILAGVLGLSAIGLVLKLTGRI